MEVEARDCAKEVEARDCAVGLRRRRAQGRLLPRLGCLLLAGALVVLWQLLSLLQLLRPQLLQMVQPQLAACR